MNRTIKRIIASFLSISMLAGCGGSSGGNDTGSTAASGGSGEGSDISGKITFWTQDTMTWQTYFGNALERFREAYPNVEVDEEYFSDFSDKLTQSFAADTEADVIFTYNSVQDWANAGKLLEVPDSVYSADEMKSTFYEGAYSSKIFDGKFYAVPDEISVESPTLYVNMTKLNELGVSLPDGWVENNGPSSWEELVDFAKSLTVRDGSGNITQAGLSYTYAQWEAMFLSLIWQYGGDYRDEANDTVHFQTDEAKKALEFMLRYEGTGEDALCSGTGSRYDEFVQGTAVMCVGAPWYAGSFEVDIPDVEYQCFNMPSYVDGAEPISLASGGWAYTVTNNCKDQDAAWAFVKFMTSAEEVGDWAITTGALPSRSDALADLDFDKNTGSVNKAIGITTEVLPYAQEDGAYLMTPSTLTYSIIREAIYQLMEDGDIDACLETIQTQAETMIEENKNH